MKILVIGESCRDVFHYGKCDRLAPEAPAPVFNPLKTVENGGMAKNVYKNLLALGIDANDAGQVQGDRRAPWRPHGLVLCP